MSKEQKEQAGVYLIGGFLGSGKTTLIRNILNWKLDLSRTVVLVNEFGQAGLDGDLLEGLGSEVVELANGCICCSLMGDMIQSMGNLLARFRPRRIMVEATGVADPFEIVAGLRDRRIKDRITCKKVVTVVDADFWAAREMLGPLFFNQITAADLVLLNKIDLVQQEKVPEFIKQLRELHPQGRVVPTHHCQIDPGVLWEEKPTPTVSQTPLSDLLVGEGSAHHAHGAAPELGFVCFSFTENKALKEECFRSFVDSLPFEVFRMKGFVRLGGRRLFVNFVGGKAEWSPCADGGDTRIAFVGFKVDPEDYLSQLRFCVEQA